MAARGWRCRACLSQNPPRTRKCGACARKRPKKREPKHLSALRHSYEHYIAVNGGKELCGICGRPPRSRRLDRDHLHDGDGTPRGLLCAPCNRSLTRRVEQPEWLLAALKYVQRFTNQTEES